ncbi:hypothetical protein PF005_g18588 [Phytophthora fragariae]|uniref:Uncharacterized protein n=2 Tax=Phytophthora TaxID=4783 RepID=A0A6A3XTX3_9STRA|nr:hypothetical protein PF003_g27109 [Phytophthora fragariae]KAE9033849.1 hypothetical protein PR002_g8456 [Phytophthora rubi]KAE8932857.1 hypothetical protein PF009_g17129 [Phytophthora fragariae]KAE8993694.1 hypothetical protein PF011_g17039 [Phytophthora fragariae]KAE9038183.1 hypothetical protein PR001_g8061 [Phytophthora rubi]
MNQLACSCVLIGIPSASPASWVIVNSRGPAKVPVRLLEFDGVSSGGSKSLRSSISSSPCVM